MSFWELFFRLVLAFVILFTLTRLMGRKEISQMTFFNFVSAISIGTIGASLSINSSISIRNGIIALAGWTAFTIAMGFINIKSKKARAFIEGEPIILIKKGKIMDNALKKAQLDIDTLNAALRQKNVFSLSEVDYAIFETNGELSILKKEAQQPLTKADMKIPPAQPNIFPIPAEVISDGKILTANLEKLNLDEQWLNQQLKALGAESVADVFYAEVQKDGSLYIDYKNDLLH